MTASIALEYIPKRMCELGYGSEYLIRFRHFVLQPEEKRKLDGNNQLFVLTEPFNDMRVESTVGLFDLSEDQVNELYYEHRGIITITNYAVHINHVRFIQVISEWS